MTRLGRRVRRQIVAGGELPAVILTLLLNGDGEAVLELRRKRAHHGQHFNLSALSARVLRAKRPALPQLALFEHEIAGAAR